MVTLRNHIAGVIMSLYVASITVDQVIEAVGAFIQPFVGSSVQIIRAQVNRVAPPSGPFVELTELFQSDLEYPLSWYDTTYSQGNILGPKRIAVQADFYGPSSGDWCAVVKSAIRTPWGVAQFPSGIAPLYTDDGHEAPLITGEEQYLRRWALTIPLQYNPMVSVPFAVSTSGKIETLENVTP